MVAASMGTMWRDIFTIFLAMQPLQAVQALSLAKRDTAAVVAIDVSRNHVSDPVARDMRRKRSLTVSQKLNNEVSCISRNEDIPSPYPKLSRELALTLKSRKRYTTAISH